MQPENWEKVKELLDEVLEIEPHQRQKILKNPIVSEEIRAEVESLISFEGQADYLMNLSAIEFSRDFFHKGKNPRIAVGTVK